MKRMESLREAVVVALKRTQMIQRHRGPEKRRLEPVPDNMVAQLQEGLDQYEADMGEQADVVLAICKPYVDAVERIVYQCASDEGLTGEQAYEIARAAYFATEGPHDG